MQVAPEIIKDIAGTLDIGLKVFIDLGSHEIIEIPDEDEIDYMDAELWRESINKVRFNPKNYKEIKGMSSRDSYEVMQDFIETVSSKRLQDKLLQAIEGRKPFANFSFQIDNSGEFRELWFAFKNQRMIEWVTDQLSD